MAAVDCGALPMGTPNVATFDAGPSWGCFQQKCATTLAACAADTCCDQSYWAALQCAADAGSNSAVTSCFATNYAKFASPNATPAVMCLTMYNTGDAACPPQYPAGEGGTTEGGGGEGGGGEAGGGDGGTTTDAPTGG